MVIVYKSYCLNCARFIHEEEGTHLSSFPTHAIVNYAIEDTYYATTGNDPSFKVGAPVSGTGTVTISGYDDIESAIEQALADINSLEGDLISFSGSVDNLPAVDVSINVSGTEFTDAGISGTTVQAAVSEIVSILNSLDARRAVNYVFTSGQSGQVLPYAESKNVTFDVAGQIIFQGTNFLTAPTAIQALISVQSGHTGTIRLFDVTNAVEIGRATTTSAAMEIVLLPITAAFPAGEAILEIQIMVSSNNKFVRVGSVSLRWGS